MKKLKFISLFIVEFHGIMTFEEYVFFYRISLFKTPFSINKSSFKCVSQVAYLTSHMPSMVTIQKDVFFKQKNVSKNLTTFHELRKHIWCFS